MARKGRELTKRYVMLEDRMTDSAAWTSLSFKAVWVYIELRKQYNYSKGGHDHLVLPYSKVSWKMNKSTYSRAKKELIHYGFIRVVQHGGLPRLPTVYALSDVWEKKSREIVDKEGREAIKLGHVKKPSYKNNLKNLEGKRRWEK